LIGRRIGVRKILRVALVAIPTALVAYAPAQEAEAHPMVAIGWLWAAGAGGLLLGFLGGNAYAAHQHVYVAPPPETVPVDSNCQHVTVRYHGHWHHALICD
jgi:hypothetical protein